jgi:hypothetical protein
MPTTSLERNADKVYRALIALGDGWHSRHEIAEAMGAARFHSQHVAGLELLVTQGKVIAERHEIPDSPIPQRWEYQLAKQEANEQIDSRARQKA